MRSLHLFIAAVLRVGLCWVYFTASECVLKQEICEAAKDGKTLTKAWEGQCTAPTACMRACNYDYVPVCGSDGMTYCKYYIHTTTLNLYSQNLPASNLKGD